MKKSPAQFGIALLILLAAGLPAAVAVEAAPQAAKAATSVAELLSQTRPVVIAHRGCWEFGPENSLKALKACFALGADMVEGDLRSTKDGVLVLMHDDSLDRTTNLTGKLRDYTYRELRKARLRVGAGGKDALLTHEGIPRFQEMLRVADGHIPLLLHVKEENYDQIYQVVAAEHAQTRVAFLGEAPSSDAALRAAHFFGHSAYIPIIVECLLAQRTENCYRADQLGQAFLDYANLKPVAYLTASEENSFLTQSASSIRDSGAKIMGSNIDETRLSDPDAIWGSLLKSNVSLILSDRASVLIAYLKSKGLR